MSLEILRRRLRDQGATVAGVLSGTSADGIDVALARFRAESGRLEPPEPLAFEIVPFEPELAQRVAGALDGSPITLRDTALLHRDLGRAFGRAALGLARREGASLDLVGSHGQTVWHHDGVEPSGPASLQLGEADFVANEAACAVASDFRQADLAAGGEGAPVSIYADDLVFARAPRPLAILNLGGIANLSFLDGDVALAFDTGPANRLLDGLASVLLDAPFDVGGQAALAGRASEPVVRAELQHPFFAEPPPKSTGRDTFGEPWLMGFLERSRSAGLDRAEDVLATGVDLVAAGVELGMGHLPRAPRLVAVAGGGAHNRALLGALERRLGVDVMTSDAVGVDPDAREALVFATLAARCALGEGVTRPSATGATRGRVLGRLSAAPGGASDSRGRA